MYTFKKKNIRKKKNSDVQQTQELTVKDKEIPLVPFLLLGYIIFSIFDIKKG